MKIQDIKAGDRVTILVPAGLALRGGRAVQEWAKSTGRAVMPGSLEDSWVLNMGGRHGTAGIATPDNFVSAKPSAKGRERAQPWQNRRFP